MHWRICWWWNRKIVRLRIFSHGDKMAKVISGGTGNFRVEAQNKHGEVVAATDITVTVDDAAKLTATVTVDGKTGSYTSVGPAGIAHLVAHSGAIVSDPFEVDIAPDTTVAKLVVFDAPSNGADSPAVGAAVSGVGHVA